MKYLIKIGPVFSSFSGKPPLGLRDILSFYSPKYWFSPKYKEKLWDGKIPLLRGNTFPTGLLDRVLLFMNSEELDYEIQDTRIYPIGKKLSLFLEFDPYEHQRVGLAIALEKRRGIFAIATAGGKTELAIMIASSFGLQTIFVTHLKGLLHQTKERFENALGIPIGIVGDGIMDPKKITIASIKTLLRMKQIPQWVKNVNVLICDEVHHLTSPSWVSVMQKIPAVYRFGLSGTIDLKGNGMLLEAYTGPILQKIDVQDLKKNDIINTFSVKLVEIKKPMVEGYTYSVSYKKGIVENKYRNGLIIKLIKYYAEVKGDPVLVLFRLVNHGKLLSKLLCTDGVKHHMLYQKSKTEERKLAKVEMDSGKCNVIVASSIFDEGEDLPKVSVLILAGGETGGTDGRKLLQRIGRVLRKSEGKNKSVIIDFNDKTNPYLRNHSIKRIAIYKKNKIRCTEYEL